MITVEMTGREDLEGPWKIAIAGFPGAGKTLLSSTASNPLFVFFEENPRIKSIARRHIPHIKLVNSDDGQVTVQDQLSALAIHLQLNEHDYETLVIDTGDELFQRMKEGRRIKNGGEFNIGDWGWIADTYREVVNGLIDLPMNVIVLYHLKSSQEGEDGVLVRELALQGAAKDEAAGWFDVVGVLDTFETADEQGDDVTKRVLLTHQSRTYPWVKDHSGQMPPRWAISENVVGDIPRLLSTLSQSGDGMKDGQEHQVLEVVETPERVVTKSGADVPTPEELHAKKQESSDDNEPPESEAISPEPEPEPESEAEAGPKAEADEQHGQEEGQEAEPADEGVDTGSEPEPIPTESEVKNEAEGQDEESSGDASVETATAEVEKQLGAEQVYPCEVCSEEVEDEDLRDLTKIRFRKVLCRTHFKEKLAATRA